MLCVSVVARSEEGNVGNGGDADVAEFVSLGRVLVRILESHSGVFPELNFQKFEKAVNQTTVTVDERTFLKGKEVDGINWSRPKRIRFNRSRWKEMTTDLVRKTRFVFHEYLGVLRKEINHYRISSRLTKEHLKDLLSPDFTIERASLVVNLCFNFETSARDQCHLAGFSRIADSVPDVDLPVTRTKWTLETVKALCSFDPQVKKQVECLSFGAEHTLSAIQFEESSAGGKLLELSGVGEALESGLRTCNLEFADSEKLKDCLESNIVLATLFLKP